MNLFVNIGNDSAALGHSANVIAIVIQTQFIDINVFEIPQNLSPISVNNTDKRFQNSIELMLR